MNTADWQSAEEAFHRILDLPEDQRPAALAELPDRLRVLVQKLLTADHSGDRIARAIEGAATLVPPPGRVAGAYRLVRQIGAGGMGAVYLAVRADDTFEKKVAVKFVLRGLDSSLLRERFDSERRILARLEHPSIARLLDAGETPEGQPYLVLEYVEGTTIVEHAQTAGLPVRQRVELFRRVCEAVQYAHQSLVVHRDIKPSNIMIDAAGAPKLLDFGIAKLIDPVGKAQAAATIFRLLTPDYASPEQIRGEHAGVASDIYSLGAVLYELLTGSPPFRLAGMTPADAERAITQTGPPKPSIRNPELRRVLHGDLDNIILMAMRKEPHERYPSVAEFAADLGRYLDGRPVIARDYRPWERAAKFVRRNRVTTFAAAAAAASLVAGTVMAERSAIRAEEARRVAVAERLRADEQRSEAARQAAIANEQAREAETQRAEAERQRAEAAGQRAEAERRYDEEQTAIARMLQNIYVMGPVQGSTAARRGILEKAVPYLEKLAAEPRANDEVRENLAHAYEGLGYLLASTTSTATGEDRPRGMTLLKKAKTILDDLHRRHPANPDFLYGLTQTGTELGEIAGNTISDFSEARAYLAESIEDGERVLELLPNDPRSAQFLMRAYITRMLAVLRRDPRLVSAQDIARFDRLSEIASRGNPQNPRRLDAQAYIATVTGLVHMFHAEYAEAGVAFENALKLRERRVPMFPNDAGVQRMLTAAFLNVGDVYARLDGPGSDRAAKAYLRMIAMAEKMATDTSDRTTQFNLSTGLGRYAALRREDGDAAGALVYAERALAIARTLAPPQENALNLLQNHLVALRLMADIQHGLRKTDEAVRLWRDALTAGEALIARFDPEPTALVHTARSAIRLAQNGPAAERVALARKALAYAERAAAATGSAPWYEQQLMHTRGEAAVILADADLRAEARALAARIAPAMERLPSTALRVDWPAPEREKVVALARP